MANFKIKTWRKVHHLGINCESKSLYLAFFLGGSLKGTTTSMFYIDHPSLTIC